MRLKKQFSPTELYDPSWSTMLRNTLRVQGFCGVMDDQEMINVIYHAEKLFC
jgi:hypothetical protein